MRKIFFISILISLLISPCIKADHILGGYFTYKPYNKDSLEVKLVLIRNAKGASFDNQVDIGLYYEGNGNLLAVYSPLLDSLGSYWKDSTTNMVVQQGYYTFHVSYNDLLSSPILTFIRCCRGASVNVKGTPGMTVFCHLPYVPSNLPEPRMLPFIIKTGSLNHKVVALKDIDGDSMDIQIGVPYEGGDEFNPKPGVATVFAYPSPASYNNGYDINHTLGTDGSLTATSPSEGKISLMARNAGMYAIGINISEYRNKTVIGTSHCELTVFAETDSSDFKYIGSQWAGINRPEPKSNKNIVISPNPIQNQFTISSIPSFNQGYWKLYSLDGRELLHGFTKEGQSQVNILADQLKSGIYLIKVYDNNSAWETRVVK